MPGKCLAFFFFHVSSLPEYLVLGAIRMQASDVIPLARLAVEVSGKCTGEARDRFSALLIILQ